MNPHKLQPPFDQTQVHGNILAMKVAEEDMEQASNEEFFLNYTKEEYAKFAARTDVVPPNAMAEDDEEEEEHCEESEEEEEGSVEGEDDESDEDDGEAFMDLLMGQVLKRFVEENGREPEEQELLALKSAIAQKMGLTE